MGPEGGNRSGRGFDSKWYVDVYLRSPHWAALRERYARERSPEGCARCGNYPWQLHHLTYENLGNESLDDLIPLCGDCHARAHGKTPDRSSAGRLIHKGNPVTPTPTIYRRGERVVHHTLGPGRVVRMTRADVVEVLLDGESSPRRFGVKAAPLARQAPPDMPELRAGAPSTKVRRPPAAETERASPTRPGARSGCGGAAAIATLALATIGWVLNLLVEAAARSSGVK